MGRIDFWDSAAASDETTNIIEQPDWRGWVWPKIITLLWNLQRNMDADWTPLLHVLYFVDKPDIKKLPAGVDILGWSELGNCWFCLVLKMFQTFEDVNLRIKELLWLYGYAVADFHESCSSFVPFPAEFCSLAAATRLARGTKVSYYWSIESLTERAFGEGTCHIIHTVHWKQNETKHCKASSNGVCFEQRCWKDIMSRRTFGWELGAHVVSNQPISFSSWSWKGVVRCF